MVNWMLIDWRPDNINRGNCPEVWDNIYRNKVIPEDLKKQLLREQPTLLGKSVEFAIYFSREGYAELAAYSDGRAYANGGVQWSYIGSEKIDKRDRGARMKFFPPGQRKSANSLPRTATSAPSSKCPSSSSSRATAPATL